MKRREVATALNSISSALDLVRLRPRMETSLNALLIDFLKINKHTLKEIIVMFLPKTKRLTARPESSASLMSIYKALTNYSNRSSTLSV